MQQRTNEFGQPIGAPVPDWHGAKMPDDTPLTGRYCRLERLNVERHADELYDAYGRASDARDWTYLSVGPFDSLDAYRAHVSRIAGLADPCHYAVIDLATGKAVGTLALMRIDATHGVIEVGFVTYSPLLQKTRAGTEAIFLLIQHAFDTLGYRRFEWKCDSLNAPSRAAALRYGFTFEGIFRQAIVYRARNRDTAWFSIIDSEWPAIRPAFNTWLEPSNFDAQGAQVRKLAELVDAQRERVRADAS
ncbi:GNAT family N-acetyltransferase [Paraburkholderia rhizosphaerae]|uniref:RimJ/RimL family protein N-acetyltransferase n=1 Tax=Paraburkholderia rhizosphaerae TaxID=480658 RepID=A0A4R8M4R8_9BURK|nr:GNAT family protein [Paraburkholderia rhizosphaerae]TDY54802.1 RimJ/RimL family protein N-acetyltransferase [Paraburkholderia rhizosphaerae]